MNKQEIIQHLNLQPHPVEGGYFQRTYSSELMTASEKQTHSRPLLSSIYYLLTDDNPIGFLHKNRSDIIHYFHSGSPLHYTILSPEGTLEHAILGPELNRGQQLQLIVKGGYWKSSELLDGEWGLISEAVSPGFSYDDNELADAYQIQTLFPQHWRELQRHTATPKP